ncbi:hypothetical protein PC129_g19048 [Phytophthora cactorum]|uniref:Uncharacterized protein n=1 Tax=Phytophthora cactorum TaxID=29920 RepID=A0A8T1B9R4_9STRA|nr:hypothetical protein Pcac1_g5383 [Phytophthora cactorum]KAG3107299.1 hypothetical protein PI125_g12865 [Phytophthora idaei]KAG2807321.1 hypothetical protein PC112_g17470 [Phytophthora cactorum]KAG2836106.1 hypothetical protein PC113_g20097 [Phytophthora cactorum]KAG2842063.1 hypothetical protein PC111_g2855 [Phytophthora cactorum]
MLSASQLLKHCYIHSKIDTSWKNHFSEWKLQPSVVFG